MRLFIQLPLTTVSLTVAHSALRARSGRGKLLNVRDASAVQITENAEIQALKQILGLQHGKVWISEHVLLKKGNELTMCRRHAMACAFMLSLKVPFSTPYMDRQLRMLPCHCRCMRMPNPYGMAM
jgi:hypothetical protein